ncbi:hypothetical protein GJAV_G00089040 [Gymnothorax javanicus]|nr:hypothetical protein GJAV_G00089040 [Gymnothorax javanicus]
MFCQTEVRWVLLSAVLCSASTPETRGRPTQCDTPRLESDMNSFLWAVRRDPSSTPSYLFGTIHVPYTRVWDFIPESSKRAFRGSNSVYFELDLTDPQTISRLTSCQLLPQGESLQSLLPPDLYRRLNATWTTSAI